MQQEPIQTPRKLLSSQPLILGCVALLFLASTLVVGLAVGFGLGRFSQSALAFTPGVGNGAAQGRSTDASQALGNDFAIFWEALDLVYRDFYGDVPDPKMVTYDAIRGVVNKLGDPNTSFLAPDEAEYFRAAMEGSFEGIGARVAWDEERNTVRIVEPFENQPAWRAGIKRNDLVLAVDGESIIDTDLSAAIDKIRGEKDTQVTLTIEREGEAEPFDVVVTRDRVETPTISTETLGANNDIAYVRLYTFNQNSGQLVRQAVADAMQRKPKALVFDLRGNSGGLLRQAVVVTNVFLQDQVVLLERFSDGRTETYRTDGKATAADIPMVVLVNEGSASASEIVAGALQDHGRAKLVGVTTYGKGSVQLPHTLSDGSIMRVTIARWFTPLDRSIDGAGLVPDIVVELPEAQPVNGDDPQMDAAVKYLDEQN